MMIFKWGLCVVMVVLSCQMVGAQNFPVIKEEGEVVVDAMPGRVIEIRCLAGLAHLIRSGQSESLKVETVDNRVFVTPFHFDETELIIIDQAGKSFRLKFQLSNHHETGLILGSEKKRPPSQKSLPHQMNLFFKGLIEEKPPLGAMELAPAIETIEQGMTQWRMKKKYQMGRLMGYVFEVHNLASESIFLATEEIVFPGLLAVSVETEVLHPQGMVGDQTRVFLIAQQ